MSGAFCRTPVPTRPRSRGERRSLRTFSPGASLRPGSLAFNPDAHTSTPFDSASDAFELHLDVASYGHYTLRDAHEALTRGNVFGGGGITAGEDALTNAGYPSPVPALLCVGDVLLMDSRTIHRGTANHSCGVTATDCLLLYCSFQVRSVEKFFTHCPVSTLDRVPFQLTDGWPSDTEKRAAREHVHDVG